MGGQEGSKHQARSKSIKARFGLLRTTRALKLNQSSRSTILRALASSRWRQIGLARSPSSYRWRFNMNNDVCTNEHDILWCRVRVHVISPTPSLALILIHVILALCLPQCTRIVCMCVAYMIQHGGENRDKMDERDDDVEGEAGPITSPTTHSQQLVFNQTHTQPRHSGNDHRFYTHHQHTTPRMAHVQTNRSSVIEVERWSIVH